MNDGPLYVVSVLERLEDGRLAWRGLLSTRDEEEAKALHASLIADEDVKARIEVVEQGKR
ncbi:hypothetical protein EOD10_11790 [Mesorhizobium sp. M7A.T.Ca.TU.009.01.3.2]|uniref:hypothetical protein n=1 Tax=Mesorhizobium sp. M7A.F.Ca.MR.362.00.0.0 TaxID=2496779 RepID=UPI000FD25EC2|nr:hypothetical protein [Mesorhizobium sp. M7A.F.Ca.MR.362.00.0.0]RUU15498.1 hypothetical protein EOD10_11790 [Mesorhizobium sp. M7A.T.Ca.TU.009.01.3.2]RUU81302.1 hypothetical protein EOC06_08840 [Mesorhizobium sp. M7A.F.Ca.MR.362.00.0.0]